MKITYQQLVEYLACPGQMRLFRDIFGDEVKITKNICKKYCCIFDFEWVMRRLFPIELRDKYYQDVKPINDKYLQDIKSIDHKYVQSPISAYNKYLQDCKSLENKHLYNKAMLFYKLSLTLD